MAKFKYIILLLVLLTFSCKKEREIFDVHYDYFPIATGTWVIYDVDSISYNDFTMTIDSFYFQVKEVVESEFIDNEGRPTQRLERYYKEGNDSIWVLKNVWTMNRTSNSAEKVEHNVRFIKLVFPIRKNLKWNGNRANTYPELDYKYREVHAPYAVNQINFDSCVIVQHQDELTLFTHKFSEEVYAKHIGNVYAEHINLIKEADGKIVSGYNYTYKAISWGN